MTIGPVSEGSSQWQSYSEKVKVSSPAEQAPTGSFNEHSQTPPLSPSESTQSFIEGFADEHEPLPQNRNSDPSAIREGRINRALRGTPVENPEKVDAGITLNPSLKESPNIAHNDEPHSSRKPGSSTSVLSKAAGDVLIKGGNLAKRMSPFKKKPSAPPQSPSEVDAKIRSNEAVKRQRDLVDLQDNPEDKEAMQNSLGINRKNKDGSLN